MKIFIDKMLDVFNRQSDLSKTRQSHIVIEFILCSDRMNVEKNEAWGQLVGKEN